MALKIAQLSDCHLPADPARPYRKQNADANLAAVWKSVESWGPDIVMLTGDLSEDGSPASYDRLREMLATNVPVLALPGNHDEPDVMREYFPNGPWDGPLAWAQGDWNLVLTDSTRPRKVEGYFEEESAEQLRFALSECEEPHLLVALHHQPVPVDAPWIDKYALRAPGAFLEVVGSEPRVRCVVWGHIHHHFAEDRNGILLLGAPSTAANSLPRTDRFELNSSGPAARTLELGDDGSVGYGQLLANTG